MSHPGKAVAHRARNPMNHPAMLPFGVPSLEQIRTWYAVNRPGWELVKQSLYDSTAYPAAGTPGLSFFQVQQGQGTGFGGGAKTTSDTNMLLAGQLPAAQEFVVDSIEVFFFPTTPTVAAQMPAAFGAQAIAQIVNDAYIFRRSGTLTLFIGSKNYIQEAPIMKFPASREFHIDAAAADVSTTGASFQTRIAYGNAIGRPYKIEPTKVLLISSQNFSVSLTWPEGNQAITNPARVFVSLEGMLARQSQ